MRDVTLREVAALAGVSARTVSNVVNGYAPVNQDTRARVQRAVEQLGYRPNVLARNLARGRSGQIAFVVPYLDTPYFSELLQGVIQFARIQGYNVLIDQTDGNPTHERALISRGGNALLFDGVIFSPLGLSQAELVHRDPTLALVVLGERASDGTFDHVGIDDVAASRELTGHLLELGRRRIAAIGDQPYPTGEAAQRRTRGFREAHEHARVPVYEHLVMSTPRFNRADGARAMAHLLDSGDPPDAVFCYSDLVALGALHTLAVRGVRVPEDIAVVGYDDIEDGAYSNPPVTTISPDKQLIARTAVDLLVRRMAAGPGVPGEEVRAPHRLIIRESTVGRASAADWTHDRRAATRAIKAPIRIGAPIDKMPSSPRTAMSSPETASADPR